MVVLGPAATSETFYIDGTIQSTKTNMYMNIGNDTTSYKTLVFDKLAGTNAWGLEGDTIITTKASSYGRREFTLLAAPLRLSIGLKVQMLTLRAGRVELRGMQA